MAIRNKKKKDMRAGGMPGSSWAYIRAVASIVRQPFVVLDGKYRVLLINEAFSKTFQVVPESLRGEVIYEAGDREWDIPALRKLLEEILPRNAFFKEYEIDHEFSLIGQRNLLCSACLVRGDTDESLIFLAIEDMTAIMSIAETVALQMRSLVAKNAAQTRALEMQVERLEKELGVRKEKGT